MDNHKSYKGLNEFLAEHNLSDATKYELQIALLPYITHLEITQCELNTEAYLEDYAVLELTFSDGRQWNYLFKKESNLRGW